MQEIKTDNKKVCCSGGDDNNSGHPTIYLDMGEDSNIACPYCGKVFIHDCTIKKVQPKKHQNNKN